MTKQPGKTFIVKPNQYAQEIPETTLVKGKPYEEPQEMPKPIQHKTKAITGYESIHFEIPKKIIPLKPRVRFRRMNQQEREIVSLEERLYVLELALTKRKK